METQSLTEQKDIDCQVSEVSVTQDFPSSKHLDVKMKELPKHLEYVFSKEGFKLLVIISSTLEVDQKERLATMLHECKKVIAWSISDIKGINPFFYTHKITMEDNIRPRVQPQRTLDENMLGVVKKEMKKLLDVGIIYLILDSPWVS